MADPDSRDGVRYATPAILQFVDALHAAHDGPLATAFDAPARHRMPPIQLGMSEGRLIELLCAIARPRRAVEVGTLAGYSAIRIARGMGEGRLFTIENDPRHVAIARANIAAARLADRIEVLEGDGIDRLQQLEGPFDLVFLDADKGRYDAYGRWAIANLAPGGILLADNAYFFGRLLDEEDREAQAMRRFHREIAAAMDSVCIPTPDGLVLARTRG